MQEIEFLHMGEQIMGTLHIPTQGEQPFPGVIYLHGLTSSRKNYVPMAQALAEQRIAAMTLDIGGHGKSGGVFEKLTAADLETDGIAAYDFFVKQKGIDPRRIGLMGGSMGAMLAAVTSEARDVKSIVMRAPAAYTPEMRTWTMDKIDETEIKVFNEQIHPENDPAVRAMGKFGGSLLVIACENDTHIPRKMVQAYYDAGRNAARREFEILPGSEHSPQTEELRQQLSNRQVQWFLETL